MIGVAQTDCSVTEPVLRYSFERASHSSSLRRSPTGSGSKTEGKIFNADGYIRSHADLLHPDLPNHKSKLHGSNSSDHIVSGSEITFHSVRSSVTEVGNHEEYLPRSGSYSSRTKDPVSLGEYSPTKPSTSVRSLLLASGDYFDTQAQDISPADRWEALTRASRASTESLSQSIKERRLKRAPNYAALRQSEETPKVPEWKRLLTNKRSGEKQKQQPAKLSPKKMSKFELSPVSRPSREMMSPRKSRTGSPAKSVFGEGSGSVSQRSTSKPINGAVKAMTALFKRPAKYSPAGPTTVLTGRTDRSSIDTGSVRFPCSRSASMSKSVRSRASPSASSQSKTFNGSKSGPQLDTPTLIGFASSVNHSYASPATSSRATPKDTPTRPPPVSLRPIGGSYFAPRKAPQIPSTEQVPQRDRELDQPPSLGTMVPHLEEPPVAQHIVFPRPPQGAPMMEFDGSEDERGSSPRPGSSNSMLHAQIRSLQRQLEARAEECAQLRRRLEARDNTNLDVGRLCEQLRTARREARTWRGRAEAAEKRVAVFEQFTARVRGLRDAVAEETGLLMPAPGAVDGQVDGLLLSVVGGHGHGQGQQGQGSSSSSVSCSEHTENWEELRGRIRQTMKERAAATAEDADADDEGGPARKGKKMDKGKGPWKKTAVLDERTVQLWAIAEELLVLDSRSKGEGDE